MEKKNRLQELILNVLSQKKAVKQDEITEKVELLLEDEERSTKPKYLITRALKKMIEDNIINEHETEQSSFLSLTASGRQKLRTIKLSSQNHLVPTEWDGFWRIIIVDIPDHKKRDQDALRYILKKAQFVQIKNSVWISPYPLEHLMINMKNDMGLHEEMIILVSDKLDPETETLLQKKFLEE
jgi:phenylacetic acid degradation operon negative regulatory protein